MRTFRVALPVKLSAEPIFDSGEKVTPDMLDTFREIQIDAIPQEDRLTRAWMEFRRDRFDPIGYFVLGWRTWLQLGWEMSRDHRHDPDRTFRPSMYRGLPIVVLEHVADHLSVSPSAGPGVMIGDTGEDDECERLRSMVKAARDYFESGRREEVFELAFIDTANGFGGEGPLV